MSRSFPILRAAALLSLIAVAACGRADASARRSNVGADRDTTVASGTPAAQAGRADTLSDSALIDVADRGRIKGSEQAMWVVMISDFQCPYCKQWHDSSMAKLERDYIATGKVRFAYLHLPLSSIHRHARAEAEAALCAGVQGKFWPYSEALFAAQPTVGAMSDVTPLLERIRRDLVIDSTKFAQCRQSNGIRALVNNDIAQAQQAGVQSTPSFLIGDFLVQGAMPWPDFKKAVDTALVVARTKRSR